MKEFLTVVALASSFAAGAACAQEGKLDLAALTCEKLFEMKREQINIVLGWLQGYYLEEDGPPIVNMDKLSADALKLSGYCAAKPQEDVISAAEALFGK
jgi:acid stress chaperone HdeB